MGSNPAVCARARVCVCVQMSVCDLINDPHNQWQSGTQIAKRTYPLNKKETTRCGGHCHVAYISTRSAVWVAISDTATWLLDWARIQQCAATWLLDWARIQQCVRVRRTLFAVRRIDCERPWLDVTGSAESVRTTDGLNITLGGPFLQSGRLTVSAPGSMRRAPQKVSRQLMD